MISLIGGKTRRKKVSNYKTKWMMASIGKRNGIVKIEVQGFLV